MMAMGITFVLFLVLGVPVVFVLGLSMITYFLATGQYQFLMVVPQRMFAGMDQFVLLAIPLFILAGNVMDVGGLTRRLLSFANVFVGRFRGGSSLSAIWGSFLFSGVSGSAAADAAALGSVLIPDMKRQGYDEKYAAALIAVSSLMAPLIPPSIAMIIYGALSGTSVARLFIAGIVPALLLASCLTVYAIWVARKRNYPSFPAPTMQEFFHAAKVSVPVLLLPVIIIAGIRGGVFTATEAAAVAAIYAFLVAGVIYRALTFSHLRRALLDTAIMSAAIMLLIGMANIASFIFAIEQLPAAVVSALMSVSDNPVVILLLVNLFLLVLGMMLEIAGLLILVVPAVVGIGQALGMDPVHLGIMVVFNALLGFVTPPVGLCLFVVSGIAKAPVERVALAALPMLGVALIVLGLITFVPQLVLFLPDLLMK